MVSLIIGDWIEEGYSSIVQGKEAKSETSLVPCITNDAGENVTPKPLFPLFIGETGLDSEFLVEYLEIIENCFRSRKNILDKTKLEKTGKMDLEPYKLSKEIDFKTSIDFERKNIFLSRVFFKCFEEPDSKVPVNSLEFEKVQQRNQIYRTKLLDHSRERREVFTETHEVRLQKNIQTDPVLFRDMDAIVTKYLLDKHYHRMENSERKFKNFKDFLKGRKQFDNYQEFHDYLNSDSSFLTRFKKTLYVTEKALNYNSYKKSILSYNGYQAQLEDIMIDSGSIATENKLGENRNKSDEYCLNSNIKLHLLFYLEKLNNNYKVTCMECSSSNTCIFVAGYGVVPEKETLIEPKGIILCWNIHKSGYPERIYYTDESVTCIEISKKCPYLIAVGMRYGLVALYDLREQGKLTKVNNRSSPVRPIGTITRVCWVEKKHMKDRDGVILSSSKDGVICYWTVEQVLEGQVFRHIKRGSTSSKEKERKYLIAIDAGAWGIQMRPDSTGIFTIATAEGQVLVADCNDPVIYLNVYNCHNGPVSDLQWSPIANDVFMTCSTDQTVCVWQWDKPSPVKTLKLSDAVLKVAWSNVTSTLFLVMMRMEICIFNLSYDLHEPIAQVFAPEGVSFTYITFCKKNNWFLVGKSNGDIMLYELLGITVTSQKQITELKSTFLPDL